MRVVAGAARGRRLTVPAGDTVRPTADRVKEALFSSLQPLLAGARVLDLYAGSGALGLEALSRGATHVTFVERDRRALDALRANVEVVGLPGTSIVAGPVARALAGHVAGEPFDLVVADPPYRTPAAEVTATLAAVVDHLAPEATVVVERAVRDELPTWPEGFALDEPRRYGDTALHRGRRSVSP